MMLTEERNLPLCARLFRWVWYLCLAVLAISGVVFVLGYVIRCLIAWGFI